MMREVKKEWNERLDGVGKEKGRQTKQKRRISDKEGKEGWKKGELDRVGKRRGKKSKKKGEKGEEKGKKKIKGEEREKKNKTEETKERAK